MKKNLKFITIAFIICGLVTVIVYSQLPLQMPMQFSLSGEVNYTLPKYIGVSVMPLLALGITLWQYYQEEFDTKNSLIVAFMLFINCCFISFIAFCL